MIIDSEQTCHFRERSAKEAAVDRMGVVQQLSRNQPSCKLTTPSIPEGPPSKATQNSTPFKKCKETQEEAVRANKDRDTSQEAKVLTSNGNEIHREIPNIYFLIESLTISDKCIFYTFYVLFLFQSDRHADYEGWARCHSPWQKAVPLAMSTEKFRQRSHHLFNSWATISWAKFLPHSPSTSKRIILLAFTTL